MPIIKIRRVDFYPDDWLAGTVELSDLETGVYIRACALIYARSGPIKTELLRRVCSSHGNSFNFILRRLETLGKLVRNDDEIDSKRCRNELERSSKRLRNAFENGAKGGRPKGLGKAGGFANGKPNNHQSTINIKKESDSETLTNLPAESDSKNPKQTIGAKSPISRRAYAKDFERFWEKYPHRGGLEDPKKPAADQFAEKVKAGADPEEIITGAQRYAGRIADQHTELKFVPQAVKWLRQEQWRPNGHDQAVPQRVPERSKPTGPPPPLVQRAE